VKNFLQNLPHVTTRDVILKLMEKNTVKNMNVINTMMKKKKKE